MNQARIAQGIVLLCACAVTFTLRAGEDKDFRNAEYLYKLQEYKLAADALQKYLAAYPQGERREQVSLLLAESSYQLKNFPDAARHFAKFVADFPASPHRFAALQRAVKVHWQTKDFAKAVAFAETFVKENSGQLKKDALSAAQRDTFAQVLYFAGDSCYALNQFEKARDFWQMLRTDFAGSGLQLDAADGLGWIAFKGQHYDEALKEFAVTAAAAKHPKAAASQLMLARCLDQLGRTGEALAALDKVAALPEGKEQARDAAIWRPLFLLKAKRGGEAVAACKALALACPADPELPLALKTCLVQIEDLNRPADSLELAELYLSACPKGADRTFAARVKARMLHALKRADEAVAAARQALKEAEALAAGSVERQEQHPLALLLLGDYLGSAGEAPYQAVLKEYPKTRYAAIARYQLALLTAQSGKTAEALAQMEDLLKNLPAGQPESAVLCRKTLFAAADLAFRLKRRESAEKHLQAYAALPEVQADPAGMELDLVRLHQGWCRVWAGDFAGAAGVLDNALAGKPRPEIREEMLYLRSRTRCDEAQAKTPPDKVALQKALEDGTTLLREAPASAFAGPACYNLAQALQKGGAPAEALPWLDRALALKTLEPGLRADALLLHAGVQYGLNRYAGTLADLDALCKEPALRKQEQLPLALLLKGLCLEALPGKTAEAEAAYGELLALNLPGNNEVKLGRLRRAKLRVNAKRFAEAETDLRAFRGDAEPQATDQNALDAAVLLALCRKEQKDAAGAQALLEKLAKLNLSGAAAFEVPFQLGNLAYEGAKNPEAAAHYQKALAAAHDAEIPRPALTAAWLNLGWSLKRAGDGKQAASAFAEVVKLAPKGPFAAEARFQQGGLLAESGDAAGALGVWREILAADPANPYAEKALAGIAASQAKQGRFDEAAKSYEQWLKQFPKGAALRETWCGLGECRLHLQAGDAAKDAFLKALGDKSADGDLDDAGERAELGLAELALARGDSADCKKAALRVVLGRGDSPWLDAALFLCGRASEEMAEPNQAIGYYRKLLADRPQSERAAAAKERLKALGAPAEEKR